VSSLVAARVAEEGAGPRGEDRLAQRPISTSREPAVSHRATLDVSAPVLKSVTGWVARHRRRPGARPTQRVGTVHLSRARTALAAPPPGSAHAGPASWGQHRHRRPLPARGTRGHRRPRPPTCTTSSNARTPPACPSCAWTGSTETVERSRRGLADCPGRPHTAVHRGPSQFR
jgi:hypothetical protein